MLDWRKAGAEMIYCPDVIATVNPGESQWFRGYDARYFQNFGWTERRLLGNFTGMLYIFYWTIFRRNQYKDTCTLSLFEVLKNSFQGYFSKR